MFRAAILIGCLCSLLRSSPAFARDSARGRPPLQAALTLGISSSQVAVEEKMPGVRYSSRLAPILQGTLGLFLTGGITAEGGVGLASKGYSASLGPEWSGLMRAPLLNDDQDQESDTRLIYLTLPLSLRATFGQHRVRPYLRLGVEFAHLLSARQKLSRLTSAGRVDSELNLIDSYLPWDLGLLGGLGAERRWKRLAGYLEFGAVRGLSNSNDSLNRESQAIRNRAFALTAGVRVPV
jgi:hypothetical protein